MTYNELFAQLAKMTDEQRMQTVTVYLNDNQEFYPVNHTGIVDDNCDVLDNGHFVLEVL